MASRKNAVNTHLLHALSPADKGRLAVAMRYSAAAGGKRLRPLLCINAAETLGSNLSHALPYACALELVHCYSLVHDDLPSMDDDAMRRGKPSCHAKFGEATAILAGTSLLTLAFDMLSGQGAAPVRALAAAAGHKGMNKGQMLDLEMTGKNGGFARRRVLEMHRLKTGMLIGASMQLGALAAGATPPVVRSMKDMGDAIGQLFQLVDDVIDEAPGSHKTGKTPGKDRSQGKPSIVVTHGMDKAIELAVQARKDVQSRIKRSKTSHRHLPDIVEMICAPLRAMAAHRNGGMHRPGGLAEA